MAIVVAFANRKGGVAKTTSCLCTSFWLAGQGKRVLMIDNDAQANLSEFFNYDTDDLENHKKTIYSSYISDTPLSRLILRNNPALIPASDLLSDVEADLQNNTLINRATILRERFAEVADRYDYILVDCPPWLNVLTINALVASSGIIIPMSTDRFASNGVMRLLDAVRNVRVRLNTSLKVLGILPTRFTSGYVNDRKNLAKVQAFAESIGVRVFEPVRRSTIFNTEADEQTPSADLRPEQQAVDLYRPLGEELLNYGTQQAIR
jgi:chromosome partitioning protein